VGGRGGRERVQEGKYDVNTAYCVHMYINIKMIHVETIQEWGRGGIKENGGGGEFKYDIFDTL
jgi:hypothetical protein